MALIRCKECGKEISENAVSCPNCGNILKRKTKSETKKVGTILILIASSTFIIISILLKITSLIQANTSGETPIMIIGIEPNEPIFNGIIQLVVNAIYWLAPIFLILLSILQLIKNTPNKKVYGIISLILSILWSLILVIYACNGSCCDLVFIVNSITAFIGSIIIFVELIGDKKSEIATDNKR